MSEITHKELLNKQNIPEDHNDVSRTGPDDTALAEEKSFDISKLSPDDIVSLYMREMGHEPLLTYEEEQRLGRQVDRGNRAAEKLKKEDVDPALTDALRAEAQQGQKARDHLIKANTRLVISVAKRYLNHGVPMLDLIQGGNLGLIRAAEKYDHKRGYRFSTYATWWIRQGITRTLASQKRAIRVPIHMNDRIVNLRKLATELEKAWARKPTMEELAEELEIDLKVVRFMLETDRGLLSLDMPITEEEGANFGDFVENTDALNPSQMADQQLLKEKIEDLLLTLSPREARILRDRFGLHDRQSLTLEEIGQKFGLTRERIRQLEKQALRKLRHPTRARKVRAYWR